MNIPFTVYDFFAYLSSGSILVISFDYLFGKSYILQNEIPLPIIFLFILLSYILGHVIAGLASYLLENVFVEKILKRPMYILLGEKANKFLKIVFPGYYKTLPPETIERIRKQASDRGIHGGTEAIFFQAFALSSRDKDQLNRLDEFRNLYGFARNLTLSLFLTAIFFLGHALFFHTQFPFWQIVFALILSIGMLYRYLKFFRQYSFQLFLYYSELTKE